MNDFKHNVFALMQREMVVDDDELDDINGPS